MTKVFVLKIALGVVCFVLGAAGLMAAIGLIFFVDVAGAYIPAMYGAVGAILLWIAFRLLRQVRWHND